MRHNKRVVKERKLYPGYVFVDMVLLDDNPLDNVANVHKIAGVVLRGTYFPRNDLDAMLLQVEQAKAVCQRCSVTSECLQWALDSGQDAGVWGGMSEDERRLMKRRGGLRVRAHSA